MLRNIFAREDNEPFSRRCSFDCDCSDSSLKRSIRTKFEPSNVHDVEVTTIQPPAATVRESETAILSIGLKFGKPGSLTRSCFDSSVECLICPVQPAEDIFQYLTAHLFVLRKILFKDFEFLCLIIFRDSFPATLICIYSLLKSSVVKTLAKA